MGVFMVGIVVVTTRGRGTTSMVIALLETIPLIFLFVVFDLWMARKVYKRVTGREAPRPEKRPRAEKASRAGRSPKRTRRPRKRTRKPKRSRKSRTGRAEPTTPRPTIRKKA